MTLNFLYNPQGASTFAFGDSRWYSTDSLRTSATTAATPGANYCRQDSPKNTGRKPKKSGHGAANSNSVSGRASASASAAPKTRSVGVGTKRAESVHDLRKIEEPLPVMKVRVPRDTRTDLRPKKQLFVTRLEPAPDEAAASGSGSRDRNSNSGLRSAKSFIRKKLFRKPSRASNQDSSGSATKKRECYVLEELACIEVVPVEDNNFERVSL